MKAGKIDYFFFWTSIALLGIGLLSFVSASLGIFAKNIPQFYSVLFNQLAFGLGGGIAAFFLFLKVPYQTWRTWAPFIFIGALLITCLVFVPSLSLSHGGARRWISIGNFQFQPVEFLKIGFIFYFAAWLSWVKQRSRELAFGAIPLCISLGVVAFVLFKQPDTKSFILIATASLAMLFVSGISWKYILGMLAIALVLFGGLVAFRPYVRERVQTFLNPSHDPSGSSFQLRQSLIAIGSGGIAGRGLGQSVQKFTYLPEPQGDSIFAVIGEEFGFIGTTLIVVLYLMFALRGIRIAYRAPDSFSRLLVTGIIILITAQVFMNIASITGLFPLTGVPLVFMSHGGTSLMVSLGMVGLLLNISRFSRGFERKK